MLPGQPASEGRTHLSRYATGSCQRSSVQAEAPKKLNGVAGQ